MIINDRAFLEGHEILIIERTRARTANDEGGALEKLQAHPAGDEFLAAIDQGLQHFAFRREPEAVVDELGIFRHQLVLEMGGAAIECDLFDAAMGEIKDRAAGGFIHAARFHSDEAVFDEIETSNTMRAAKPIQMRKQGRGRHWLSVNGDRVAALEIDFDILRLVWRILRIEGTRINIIRRFLRGG